MNLEEASVLVTGGAGFIGSNLVRRLLAMDVSQVIVLDTARKSFPPNVPIDPRIQVIRGSILDEEMLRLAFREKPDFVFHLAAHFANQKSLDYPETNLLINGLGTLRVLEYARLRDVGMTVFASSGCAMGGNTTEPMKEDEITIHMNSPYAVTKLLGELYFNFFHDTYGLPVSICRYFNVYGPGEMPGKYRNVIPNFIWSAIKGDPLPVMGTGEETRDYTYIDDIVDGTLLAATSEQGNGEAFNFASGKETTVNELVDMLSSVVGARLPVRYIPRRPWDNTIRRRASIEKARAVLDYEPKTSVEVGIEHTYNWMMTHREKIRSWLA